MRGTDGFHQVRFANLSSEILCICSLCHLNDHPHATNLQKRSLLMMPLYIIWINVFLVPIIWVITQLISVYFLNYSKISCCIFNEHLWK